MEQTCQTAFGEEIQGIAAEVSDAEILAAVRRVLTAEEVSHPEVEQPGKTSLVSALLSKLRG
ncbi:hypothetical protein [Leisingera sp. ANG-Vp]|uniref:hypothetical protein n=1 Tax=Leisingera sp. ANG-Vp TaxID=1577896 RepID=UPI00057E6C6E|nr:hypothetical protein [Leisingera sp. ANG-Vp]KIC21606.1 hypothetical protein RA20_03025 [Leisingera sp. ANG-Vp]